MVRDGKNLTCELELLFFSPEPLADIMNVS